MGPAVILIVGAIAAKVVTFGWLASIATSPVDVATRRRFLDHTDEMLDNPSLKDLGYSGDDLIVIRHEVAELRKSVEQGWHGDDFHTAVRVTAFKTYARTYGSLIGSKKLIDHQLDHFVAWAFNLENKPKE